MMVVGPSGLVMAAKPGSALAAEEVPGDPFAVLVDTTKCIGCHLCETACAEINGLPEPDLSKEATKERRKTDDTKYTVVNKYKTKTGKSVNVKTQCMHCQSAGCQSACPVGAFHKEKEGAVTWHENCFGCRYCMVACPFDIPKFEYETPAPEIKKCTFCYETRLKKGEQPGCVSVCPTGALKFGKRSELIKEAHERIAATPDTYVDHVYGEKEVGGTSWLYLSAVSFDQIGFRTDMGERPIPEYSKPFMDTVHMVDFVVPPVVLGMTYLAKRKHDNSHSDDNSEE